MHKRCKKFLSAIVSTLIFSQLLPSSAETQLLSFGENFENIAHGTSLSAVPPFDAELTDGSRQSFSTCADPSGSSNTSLRIYDGNGSIGQNVNARISFDRMKGLASHGIVTVQYKVALGTFSKDTSVYLNDGENIISKITVHPGANRGLVLQSPKIADGAGAAVTNTILIWGSQNDDGTYLAKNNWVDIKYQLNFNSKIFALSVNGTERVTGAFNSADADGLDSICIKTGDGEAACIYLDDIYAADGKDLSIAGLPTEDDDCGYTWDNIKIGGGGFVTGMVIHPTEPDLVYCRTDVGGAYRWDKDNQTWIPLTDSFSLAETSLFGIDGIAVDPNNPDIVYLAAGKASYTMGDVLKSYDRGETWTRTYFPGACFDGNGVYRGSGECIMVDPKNSNIVYCGTYNTGLWKSTNGGYSWKKVLNADKPVRSVVIYADSDDTDCSSTIYAGVISNQDGLYQSTDGGESWNLIENSPKSINRMELTQAGTLYIAASSGLFKYENNAFSDISPMPGTYNAVTVASDNDNTVMALGPHTKENEMTIPFYRSTDGGETWVNMLSTCHVTSSRSWDIIDSRSGNISSNSHCLLIDPLVPERVWLSDWFGVFKTDDITAPDTQEWTFLYDGLEEMVPRDFICPPTGKYRFIAGVADNDGLLYSDYKSYPERRIRTNPRVDPPTYRWLMSTCSLDYCREIPDYVVRVGIDWNCMPKAEISTNGMRTWQNIIFTKKSDPQSVYNLKYNGLGQVAVSSQPNPETGVPSIVVITSGFVPLVSDDLGKTWEEVSGITDTAIFTDHWKLGTHIAADTVNGSVFYIQDAKSDQSAIYTSTDFGHTWTHTSSVAARTYTYDINKNCIKAAPGVEGEVWSCVTGTYLYRSSDSANTFSRISNISDIQCFGFGKNAPGIDNPTVYAYGTVNGICGVYRSTDMGENWVRINSSKNNIGCDPIVMEGDMRTFGVVYIGTGGRGIFYGEPTGTVSETPEQNIASCYREDFESYTADTGASISSFNRHWNDTSSNADVISDPINDSTQNNVLKITVPNSSGATVDAYPDAPVRADITDISFRIAGATENETLVLNLFDDSALIATIGFLQSGNGITYNGINLRYSCKALAAVVNNEGNSLVQYGNINPANIALLQSYPAMNVWYNIKARLNFETQTLDIVASGSEISESQLENPAQALANGEIIGYVLDIPFTSAASRIDRISIYAPWGPARTGYFDDIEITAKSSPCTIENAEYFADGDTVTVKADVTCTNEDAKVIIAAYTSSGALAGTAILPAKNCSHFEQTFNAADNVANVGIFIWDSTITPLCNAKRL